LPREAKVILVDHDIFERKAGDKDLARCEVLMAWPGKAKKDLLARMKGLRMVQSMAAGVDTMDFHSLPEGHAYSPTPVHTPSPSPSTPGGCCLG
jgi:phosphoglycerate dehydrogenase-like enzyme